MDKTLTTYERDRLDNDLRWIEDEVRYLRRLKVKPNAIMELENIKRRIRVMIEELGPDPVEDAWRDVGGEG